MGGSVDTVFVIFVFIMVLLFFILLVKRLYMRQNQLGVMNSRGQVNGQEGQIPTIPVPVHLHDTHGNSCPVWVTDINHSQMDTAPPPFESVVGLSKGECKVDHLSCADTSEHFDMECPPPSYEEYLGVVNQDFNNKEQSPDPKNIQHQNTNNGEEKP